jgi:hypothetical protein
MLATVKNASVRQTEMNSFNSKPTNIVQSDQSQVIVNHFEKILQNWVNNYSVDTTNKQNVIPKRIEPSMGQSVSIPIINNIDISKYNGWATIFTQAGYVVKMDKNRFTVSMP